MQSNTKLSKLQKSTLKDMKRDMKRDMPGINVLNINNDTTIAYRRIGTTVRFSLSAMAPFEKKFRRKVGEYYALSKFVNNETVCMDVHEFMIMCEQVWDVYPE